MHPRSVKTPTIPIPFHKMLMVVAIVDRTDPETKVILDQIPVENIHVEIGESATRDLDEDADVGAYIVEVDGERPSLSTPNRL